MSCNAMDRDREDRLNLWSLVSYSCGWSLFVSWEHDTVCESSTQQNARSCTSIENCPLAVYALYTYYLSVQWLEYSLVPDYLQFLGHFFNIVCFFRACNIEQPGNEASLGILAANFIDN